MRLLTSSPTIRGLMNWPWSALAEETVCADAPVCYVAFTRCPGCLVQPGGITLNDYELHSGDSHRTRFARSPIMDSKLFNHQTTQSMNKHVSYVLYATALALCLGAVSAFAGYVTPRVPPGENVLAAQSIAAHNLPTVRTVTRDDDHGHGSLRQAIADSAPGDRITFSLKLPATIMLSSTLVIDQDLTVLGPGARDR